MDLHLQFWPCLPTLALPYKGYTWHNSVQLSVRHRVHFHPHPADYAPRYWAAGPTSVESSGGMDYIFQWLEMWLVDICDHCIRMLDLLCHLGARMPKAILHLSPYTVTLHQDGGQTRKWKTWWWIVTNRTTLNSTVQCKHWQYIWSHLRFTGLLYCSTWSWTWTHPQFIKNILSWLKATLGNSHNEPTRNRIRTAT